MADKPKTGKPDKPKDEKTQSERFIETAKALGADENDKSGRKFERAFKKVAPGKSS